MAQQYIKKTQQKDVCTISFNRADKRNAINNEVISQLHALLSQIEHDDSIRSVILTGEGTVFSAGADLNWMRSMQGYSQDDNREDAKQLALLLYRLDNLNKAVVARVNGHAFGGALGLMACCDVVVAVDSAQFAFTEIGLGLVPAVISPYVLRSMGHSITRKLFLTMESFNSQQAMQWGLVHQACKAEDLDQCVNYYTDQFHKAGPKAIARCKGLVNYLHDVSGETLNYTARLIAELRVSPEGQEGIGAFLEKRKANWREE